MTTVSELSDFNRMLVAKRTLVFIQARWSGYAMRTRQLLQLLEQRVNSSALRFPLDFEIWELDLSDQVGDIWNATQSWLQPQSDRRELLMWGGWGSILWCSRGIVVESVIRVEQLIDIIEMTHKTFT